MEIQYDYIVCRMCTPAGSTGDYCADAIIGSFDDLELAEKHAKEFTKQKGIPYGIFKISSLFVPNLEITHHVVSE